MEKAQTVLDISFKSIIRFFIILALFTLLFFIREVLIWFLLALIISILVNPFVDFLELKKISRILGAGIVYTLLIGLAILIIGITAPTIIREIWQVIPQRLPEIEGALKHIGIDWQEILRYDFKNVVNWENIDWRSIVTTAWVILDYLFKGIGIFIIVFSLSLFFCIEKNKIKNFISFLFPKKKETISYVFDISQRKISLWFNVRIVNCLLMALLMYLILLISNVSFPLTFAVLIGLLSFIPLLGAIFISVMLLSFISIVHTTTLALIVFVTYLVINLVVDNIITPILSKKVLDISPSLILIAMTIGFFLFEWVGAILAIPIFAIVLEFVKNYIAENRTERIEDKKKRVIIV